MARPETDRFVVIVRLGSGVHTLSGAHVVDLSRSNGISGHEQLRVDVLQVPLERLAAQVVPQLLPLAHVAEVAQVVADPLVVVLLVLVEPDLGQADGVPLENVDSRAPLVGGALAEDVAHVGARHDLQGAPAHPRLEGELEVLAAPDVEAGVVGPEALEEGLVDGEETARHGGRLHGLGGVLVAGALPLRDGVPVEL